MTPDTTKRTSNPLIPSPRIPKSVEVINKADAQWGSVFAAQERRAITLIPTAKRNAATWLPFTSISTLSFPLRFAELVGEPEPLKNSGGQVCAHWPEQADCVAESGVK